MPLLNGGFEVWSGLPLDADHWTRFTFGTTGFGSWVREVVIVKVGTYSARISAGGYAHGRGYRQLVDATPYRGKTITVIAWGRGYNGSSCDLSVGVDGTGGWTQYDDINERNVWEPKSISGDVPMDATEIAISVRTYCPGIYGPVYTFWDAVTLSTLPAVTTNPATLIGTTSATLHGTLDDDGGEACACGFEWGETVAYGNITPTDSKTTGQTFSQVIVGLDPNKTYHFQAFATNPSGTIYGADETFTTDPLPPAVVIPTVTTNPATAITTGHATLNGFLNDDGGEACGCGFEWGTTIIYGITTPTDSKVTGETLSQVIGGLDPGTEYHFRAFATNSEGTGYGDDMSFTTALAISRGYALSREEL